MKYTHKIHGWTRETVERGNVKVTPTDDSGVRLVSFMGAGDWANYPTDRREDEDTDRIVLLEGAELPSWAHEWLTKVNAKSCESGRRALSAAIDDADRNIDRRTWGDY